MYLEDLVIEYSKTKLATCRGCKSKILVGEPRLGVESVYDEDGKVIHYWNHILCFSMGRKYKDINPILIKGYENLSSDHQQQIQKHFESGGVNRNAANKKKKSLKNKKKKTSSQPRNKGRSNSAQNKRKNSKSSSSNNDELSDSEEDSSTEESDDESTDNQNSESSEDEEEYKINKNRRNKSSQRTSGGRNKNCKELSDIDEHDDEQYSSKSKKNRKSSINQNRKSKNQINVQKEKPERMKYYILGYTYSQYDKYLDIFENLEKFDDDKLKDMLKANNQLTFGNRDKLLHRVADGKMLGAIPKCLKCKQGQLDFNYNDGVFRCAGYELNNNIQFCNKKYDMDEIKRVEWKYTD